MYFSVLQIANMCEGKIIGNAEIKLHMNNIVIDSRQVVKNSIFVAIVGNNHDGHGFIANAIMNGAEVIVVNNKYTEFQPNITYIIVDDTTKALGRIAHTYRLHFTIPFIAITGSNGKTTVKEMLKSIACKEYREFEVLATDGNLNNHLGVPLTLLKLNEQHKVAIIEMGMNHFGELKFLSNLVIPTIAVVNNVANAHIGNFNSLDDIAKAKGEIYDGLTESSIALINQGSDYANYWTSLITDPKINKQYYNSHDSDYYIKNIDTNHNTSIMSINKQDYTVELSVLGEHNYYNALTAITITSLLNYKVSSMLAGIKNYQGYKSRLERKKAFNGAIIVDDSYNANPDSVKAAILAIKDLPKPHWFILGDLKELGVFSDEKHYDVGLFAKANAIDVLLTIGDMVIPANQSFGDNSLYFSNKQDIIEYCQNNLPMSATLLIKASKSLKLWEIADALEYTHLISICE
jgi:UDP-N-acetylmuramoyl-tripeptide--D-alanyl-D-alanine ligase